MTSHDRQERESHLRVVRQDGVAVISMVPGDRRQILLTPEFGTRLSAVLDEISESPGVAAIVLTSSADHFMLGADIRQLREIRDPSEARELSLQGQRLMEQVSSCRIPVVAAIHGACVGGGLELALACHARVASDHRDTKLGQPEIQLGLIPGAGGTQRLPRVVGIQLGLDLLLSGRSLDARSAQRHGLVDEVAPRPSIVEAASRRGIALQSSFDPDRRSNGGPLARMKQWFEPSEMAEHALAENPLGRQVVFQRAAQTAFKKTRGNYPATERLLEVVRVGLSKGREAGLEAEARAFGELATSSVSKELSRLFLLQQKLEKRSETPEDGRTEVRKVAVLGAGLMGSGIVYASLEAGVRVRWKDNSDEAIGRGLQSVLELLDKGVHHGARSELEARELFHRLGPTLRYDGFRGVDVVIEAVFESLELKKKVLNEIEETCSEKTIFASNTSSLPIARIAADCRRPENVIGMHYFSPVHKMPLLEVVTSEKTAEWVTKTCVELGKRQGKAVIVVRDGPGFYTTRILAPYLNEAVHALLEGADVQHIDDALRDFGFPVGPLELVDEVGLDVAHEISRILHEAFGERMAPPEVIEGLVSEDRKGKKSGQGFYAYSDGRRRKDEAIVGLREVKKTSSGPPAKEAIAERCAAMMVNEAVRCLSEGILSSAEDGDAGAVLGLGFPPFRGGPFRYVDRVGPRWLVERLRALRTEHGERFEPAPLLVEMAMDNRAFYTAEEVRAGTIPRRDERSRESRTSREAELR